VLALALLWGGGAWRLAHSAELSTAYRIRVVQANVPQSEKWSAGAAAGIFERYMRLTASGSTAATPDVIVWPEAAIPFEASELLAPQAWTRAEIMRVMRPGQVLMFGAVRTEGDGERTAYYNSLLVLRRTQDDLVLLGVYDKHHLVPFGEFMPLERWLTPLGLKKLVDVGESFSAGPPPRPISLAGLPPVQPLICYESLFPGFSYSVAARPSWIANVSNDAWFGRTSGPWQHLNLASYRAIEEGVPLIRATPTGVSAVVDAYGRPKAELALGRAGTIDANLPAALPQTPYAEYGDFLFWVLSIIGITPTIRLPKKVAFRTVSRTLRPR
jgi:apolipoprotein N-acyltransferase